MSGKPHESKLIAVLCHTDDCCPEIHYHKHDPDDQCIEVVDDYGNRTRFGPDALLLAVPRICDTEGQWVCLKGVDGEEVYMTDGQHSELFDRDTVKQIVKIGRRRKIPMKQARRHAKRARLVDAESVASTI